MNDLLDKIPWWVPAMVLPIAIAALVAAKPIVAKTKNKWDDFLVGALLWVLQAAAGMLIKRRPEAEGNLPEISKGSIQLDGAGMAPRPGANND